MLVPTRPRRLDAVDIILCILFAAMALGRHVGCTCGVACLAILEVLWIVLGLVSVFLLENGSGNQGTAKKFLLGVATVVAIVNILLGFVLVLSLEEPVDQGTVQVVHGGPEYYGTPNCGQTGGCDPQQPLYAHCAKGPNCGMSAPAHQ
jgi:hypothetical protein